MQPNHTLPFGFSKKALVARSLGLILLFVKILAFASVVESNSCELINFEGSVGFRGAGATNWITASPGQIMRPGDSLRTGEKSRAVVQFSDFSVLRINELTTFSIERPTSADKKPLLDLKSGGIYFFSREKPTKIQFRTPSTTGAIRGTEFDLWASATGETRLALLDGKVDLENEWGKLQLDSRQLAHANPGVAPMKAPLLNAVNVIQWCLYYPAVVDTDEIALSADEKRILGQSLRFYYSGDLLEALAVLPKNLPTSDSVKIYQAALFLAVGQVDQTYDILRDVPSTKSVMALHEMIAAVQGTSWLPPQPPSSASEWLANSYYLQSKNQLEAALSSAYASVTNSPSFGFGWIRVAELEFCLGNLAKANRALARGERLSPRNAQAKVILGFMHAAQNQNADALASFEKAIELDGALANAWLGRGLCKIRTRDWDGGRKDLQVASALEPQRSLLRSYLGKAYQNANQPNLAEKELRLAKMLDPNDPTPWFYSAMLNSQLNHINKAVDDMGRSRDLNGNKALFRSKFLLDQDMAVRQANLALLYKDAGMDEVSRREAAKAIDSDYLNYSAHLFLADSYGELLDPKQYDLRYLAAANDEWLTANLLAPPGARSLSKIAVEREYQPFFSKDGFGITSGTEYQSIGAWRQYGSQYGSAGRMDYSIDTFYQSDPGWRPNNDLQELNLAAQVKAELDANDSLFLQTEYFDRRMGDLAQYYSHGDYQPNLRFTETQNPFTKSVGGSIPSIDPMVLMGFHHQWEPGMDTIFAVARLQDDLRRSWNGMTPLFLYYNNNRVYWVNPQPFPFNESYERRSTSYASDLQQIWESHVHTLILGAKFQTGNFDVSSDLARPLSEIHQHVDSSMQRESAYAYDYWEVFDPLRVTLGAGYDHLDYPVNILSDPISSQTESKERFSPKIGLIYTPRRDTTLRAHYTRSLGGVLAENEITVEPTLVGGINQKFSNIMPESSVGAVPASDFETLAFGVDHVFPTRTFVGLELSDLMSDADHTVGVFTNKSFLPFADSPSTTIQKLNYNEKNLSLTVNQLIGAEWSTGLRYSLSKAHLDGQFPNVPLSAGNAEDLVWNSSAIMNQVYLYVNFNHSSGFYSQFQSLWTAQSNSGYTPELNDSSFWQHNFFVGYRFPERHVVIQLGVLNLTDRNYCLNPLNYVNELPHERTLVGNLKFSF